MKKYYTYKIKKSVSVIDLKTVERLNVYQGFSYPQEKHVFFEFIYVLSGSVYCVINSQTSLLKTGDFRIIPPNTTHNYYSDKNGEIFIVCFQSKSEILEILSEPVNLDSDKKGLIEKIMAEAENSFVFPFTGMLVPKETPPFGAQQLTELLIEQLLIGILREKIEDSKIKLVKNNSELKNSIVEDTVSYLKNHLYGELTLSDVCKKTLYSNTYLNKLFTEKKGCTVMKYYQTLKIDEAKKLLKTDKTVNEISDDLCFSDVNYFCKVFKKYTDKSPIKYKKDFEN